MEEEGPAEAAVSEEAKQPAGTTALPEGEKQPAALPRVDPGGGHRGDIAGSGSVHHGPAQGARGDGRMRGNDGHEGSHDQDAQPTQMQRIPEGEGRGGNGAAALMGSPRGQVNKRPRAGDDDGNGGSCGDEKNAEAAASMDPSIQAQSRAGNGRWPACCLRIAY